MVTTIPTAIPPPKVPPLNLDVVVVVLGVCVVDVDVVWDVVLFVGVVGFVLVVEFFDVAWGDVLVVSVVGFVLVVEFFDVAWDVVLIVGIVGFGLIGGISVIMLELVVAILLSNTLS